MESNITPVVELVEGDNTKSGDLWLIGLLFLVLMYNNYNNIYEGDDKDV